jgi:hypothetical protein
MQTTDWEGFEKIAKGGGCSSQEKEGDRARALS